MQNFDWLSRTELLTGIDTLKKLSEKLKTVLNITVVQKEARISTTLVVEKLCARRKPTNSSQLGHRTHFLPILSFQSRYRGISLPTRRENNLKTSTAPRFPGVHTL